SARQRNVWGLTTPGFRPKKAVALKINISIAPSIGASPPFYRSRVIDRYPDRFGRRVGNGSTHLVQQPVQLLLRLQKFRNQRMLGHFFLERLRFRLRGMVIRMKMAKSLGLFKLLFLTLKFPDEPLDF